MTLEHRTDKYGNTSVVTTACALCGTSISEQQGMCDHLPHCPVLEVYAARGALSDPDLAERVSAALEADTTEGNDTRLVADGGGSRD